MGLRTGEVLALEWGDIDLVNYKLSVNKRTQRISSNKYIVTEGTKMASAVMFQFLLI